MISSRCRNDKLLLGLVGNGIALVRGIIEASRGVRRQA